jgi:hypothetical protein
MNSRMLEIATNQRTAELRTIRTSTARSTTARNSTARSSTARSSAGEHAAEAPTAGAGHPIRRRTGWALVSVGLWLASADR